MQPQGEPDFAGSHEPYARLRGTFCGARTYRDGHVRAFRFVLRGWMPGLFRVIRAPYGLQYTSAANGGARMFFMRLAV